ncbi:MAG TPA: 3-hydroxyacyl-CoA dehydrogenase NAD-binding domain-containing protein [Porticoccaceae bacterium]
MTVVIDLLKEQRLELGPPASPGRWRHWTLTRDGDDTAWLVLDRQGASVNAIDEAVLDELASVLDVLDLEPPAELVVRSGKNSGFCVGADVNLFQGMDDPGQVAQRLSRAHEVLDRLERLEVPTRAVIHGPCLGGGLELALACRQRIAVNGATFGFPEVLLGLHPGLGGTFRATELIDPLQAMTLMLTGKTLDARRALSHGLVDAVTEERHVAAAVQDRGRLPVRQRTWKHKVFGSEKMRRLAASRMVSQTAQRVSRDHYPAPYALIELWRDHGGDRTAMQQGEIVSFARLVTSATGQNLVRVFTLREKLKGQGDAGRSSAGRRSAIGHVHVVGAGTMGGDIAAWCALNDCRVTLADQQPQALARAVARAAELADRKRLDAVSRRALLDRLMPDMTGAGASHADLVIEAVPEKIAVKASVYQTLGHQMKAGALLATNTSSIPLEILVTATNVPGHFLGLHFFNPVAQMQLVEVVTHDDLPERQLQQAIAFVRGIQRLPVVVRSSPGFLVNRVLTPYLLEAMLLLDEGLAAETIDQAALDFGMPMGPVELADQVGLDVCLAVADMLADRLEGNLPEVPAWIRQKVEAGDTGRKAGKGLYTWKDGKPVKKPKASQPGPGLTDRLILPLVNTCVACLREKVVAGEDLLDGAVIFGTGFAPFRGGPLRYARQRGIDDVVVALRNLAGEHGQRFKPDPGWWQLEQP